MKKLFFMCCLLLAFNVNVKAQTTNDDNVSSDVELISLNDLVDDVALNNTVRSIIVSTIDDIGHQEDYVIDNITTIPIYNRTVTLLDNLSDISSLIKNTHTNILNSLKEPPLVEQYYPSINKLLRTNLSSN